MKLSLNRHSRCPVSKTPWIDDCSVAVLQTIAAGLGYDDGVVEFIIVDDDFIRDINNEYRGQDKPTDVISFSYIEATAPGAHMDNAPGGDGAEGADKPEGADGGAGADNAPGANDVTGADNTAFADDVVGEIYVSYETLSRDAVDKGIAPGHLFLRIGVHGMLHVLGYGHGTGDDARRMESEEKRLLLDHLNQTEVEELF